MTDRKLDFDTLTSVMDELMHLSEQCRRKIHVHRDIPPLRKVYQAKLDALDTVLDVLDEMRGESLTEEELEAAKRAWNGDG